MLNKVREEKGITLVVLIITIIVLLCLAGVIVYLVFGQDGLTGKDNVLEAERDKSSNFKEGADGSSVEYVTNNGDKYVVTIDTQNLKVKDVN